MKIFIIGRGKLGTSLFSLLDRNNFDVHISAHTNIPSIITEKDLVWLTVPDDHIAKISEKITHCRMLIHSSGSRGLEQLHTNNSRCIVHPIMTFSGLPNEIPPPPIPATIQGDNETDLALIEEICQSIGFHVYHLPLHASRSMYHAAAVISGNFSMLLYEMSVQLLMRCGLPETHAKQALLPLIRQGILNVEKNSFSSVITGPSVRKDEDTIEMQKALLHEIHPNWEKIYALCSEEIQRQLYLYEKSDKNRNV